MSMIRTNVTLPPEMIEEIDGIAGPRGRSAYVAEAVAARLRRDRLRRVLDETYGAAAAESAWRDADEAYRWVRSARNDPARAGGSSSRESSAGEGARHAMRRAQRLGA